jgi:hypothetical protein
MKQGLIGERPWEDAAEIVTVTGWACKHCRRYYGDERMARFCCSSDRKCSQCDGRAESTYTICRACLERKDDEKWWKRERAPWDGSQMIYSEATDSYYADSDEALDRVSDEDGRTFEDMRFVLCEPCAPPYFEMAEFLHDVLPSDDLYAIKDEDINETVNEWIKAHAPFSWEPGKFAWANPEAGQIGEQRR